MVSEAKMALRNFPALEMYVLVSKKMGGEREREEGREGRRGRGESEHESKRKKIFVTHS